MKGNRWKQKTVKIKRQAGYVIDIIFLFVMVSIAIFLFWKCRYGFANRDEAFYLTIPYRLYQGDALFAEEWHLSQMSGVLLLPFVAAYMKVVGSTTGILLAFRYLCTALWCAAACFFYFCLRKYHRFGALIAAVSFVLYIPFGIMALSYNSLGILNLLIAMILAKICTEKRCSVLMIFSGIFFSAAVLCCPYLAAVYLLYSLTVFLKVLGQTLYIRAHRRYHTVNQTIRRTDDQTYNRMNDQTDNRRSAGMFWMTVEGWIYATVGTAVSALTFLLFVLQRASLTKILEPFPYIFLDPEHRMHTFAQSCIRYVNRILNCCIAAKPVFIFVFILMVIMIFDRRRIAHRALYLPIVCILSGILLASILRTKPRLNYIMFPINIIGAFCPFLCHDRRAKEFFYTFWIPGMLYSFCISLTSNQGFYAISSASVTAGAGSVMALSLTVREYRYDAKRKPILPVFCTAIFVLMWLSAETVLRYKTVFWESSISAQDVLLTEGPEAGIYATKSKEKMYLGFWEEIKPLREAAPDETILYLSKNTWQYLGSNARNGSYSAWPAGINGQMLNRLEGYYEINPEKRPALVYAEMQYEAEADLFCERFGYQKEMLELGCILYPEKETR